jgi:hypothetical protein
MSRPGAFFPVNRSLTIFDKVNKVIFGLIKKYKT